VLRIHFPLRTLDVREVRNVAVLSEHAAREKLGAAVRIGAGGLFGTFGWLWTSRMGLVGVYVSTTSGLVLVERASGLPLLLSPESPEDFARALTPQPMVRVGIA
jgi:hypothetical protein